MMLLLALLLALLITLNTLYASTTPTVLSSSTRGGDIRRTLLQNVATTKVIEGEDADAERYPYHTLVRIRRTSNGDSFSCGGSLIWEDIVLTAGHCLLDAATVTHIYVNRTTSLAVGNTGYEYKRNVTSVQLHPDYYDGGVNYQNDIMILKLDSPIPSDVVRPIRINSNPNVPTSDDILTLIGLGRTAINTPPAFKLQAVFVLPKDFTSCNGPDSYNGELFQDQHLCAAGPNGRADACEGDSGGPLVLEGEDDDVMVGVVSFGEGCGDPQFPGVYARVSTYNDWIQKQICDLSQNPPSDCNNNDNETLTSIEPTSSLKEEDAAPIAITTAILTQAPSRAPSTIPTISLAPTYITPRGTGEPTSKPTTSPTIAPVITFTPTTTPEPTTKAPVTPEPTTLSPITPEPITTLAPITPEPTTLSPVTFQPTTMAPITFEPTTVAPNMTQVPTTAMPTRLIVISDETSVPNIFLRPPNECNDDDDSSCWCLTSDDECPDEMINQSFTPDVIDTYRSWIPNNIISLQSIQQSSRCSPFIFDKGTSAKKRTQNNNLSFPPCQKQFTQEEVCAFVFDDDDIFEENENTITTCQRQRQYTLQSFASYGDIPTLITAANMTHTGSCGVCSSAQDLAARMDTIDTFWSVDIPNCRLQNDAIVCFVDLGFTTECATLFATALAVESQLCATECNSSTPQQWQCSDDPCRLCWEDQIEDDLTFFAGRTMVSSSIIERDYKRSCSLFSSDSNSASNTGIIFHNPCPEENNNNDDNNSIVVSLPADNSPPVFCFSSHSTIHVLNRGYIRMKDLRIGDYVLTGHNNTYEPIYTFGHYSSTTPGNFIQLLPFGLELSSDHLVFIEGKDFIPASNVQIGDVVRTIISAEGIIQQQQQVTAIRRVTRQGVYAPFTSSGTIVVNQVVASCYVTLQPNSNVLRLFLGRMSTGIQHHDLAHAFTLPLRLLLHLLPQQEVKEGISYWVVGPMKSFQWLLSSSSSLIQIFFLIPIVQFLLCLSLLERYYYTTIIIVTTIVLLLKIRRKKKN